MKTQEIAKDSLALLKEARHDEADANHTADTIVS